MSWLAPQLRHCKETGSVVVNNQKEKRFIPRKCSLPQEHEANHSIVCLYKIWYVYSTSPPTDRQELNMFYKWLKKMKYNIQPILKFEL